MTAQGGDGDPATVARHYEWVITHRRYDSGASGLSSHVPGVEYEDLAF